MSLHLPSEEQHLAMIDQPAALNAAFDATGIKFHDLAAALAALKAGGSEIVYDETGTPFTKYDGEFLNLSDALSRLAFDQREALTDARTLPRQGAGASRPGTASKADFTTTKEKSDYITKHGFDAYQRLPLKPIFSSEVRTQEDFFKLSRAEKSRQLWEDGEACNRLPREAKSHPNAKSLNQKKVMADNLARHVASQGAQPR